MTATVPAQSRLATMAALVAFADDLGELAQRMQWAGGLCTALTEQELVLLAEADLVLSDLQRRLLDQVGR
jgi:hypothetical protein